MKMLFRNQKYVAFMIVSLFIVLIPHGISYAQDPAIDPPLSERTQQVREAIVKAVPGVDDADDVTQPQLSAIRQLDLANKEITALKTGDFYGLSSVSGINLTNNALTEFEEDTFAGLPALKRLHFSQNPLTELDNSIFWALEGLEFLALFRTQLESDALERGHFADLENLRYLGIGSTQLTELPPGVFEGLPKLWSLFLDNNPLTSLPDGVFEGLIRLTALGLPEGMPLPISLEKVGTNQVKAVAPKGAPFKIEVPLMVTGGSLEGGATSLTIPTGRVESQTLRVHRTNWMPDAVTVNIGTLPPRPFGHRGYALEETGDLPLEFSRDGEANLPPGHILEGCTGKVIFAIAAEAGVVPWYVTQDHLESITILNLRDQSITELRSKDFNGLSNLKVLGLSYNELERLPPGIFDSLTSLTHLILSHNELESLPSGIFDSLTSLTHLHLNDNQLKSLPPGIFDSLTNLTHLHLTNNQLERLPSGIFNKLTNLTHLHLQVNSFTELPDRLFVGLTKLEWLWVYDDQRPLSLFISLEKDGTNRVKAVAPTGAPFEIEVPLVIENGTLDDNATSLTIPAGSLESDTFTVTRTAGTSDAVTVDIRDDEDIETWPKPPQWHHQGYVITKDQEEPLEFTLPANVRSNGNPQQPKAVSPRPQIEIGDSNLVAVIRETLGLDADAEITDTDMADLTELVASDRGITDIAGLEHATNLTELDLRDNEITDIGALSGLTGLTFLHLGGNSISDLSALSDLTNLTHLYLGRNSISDLSALSSLTNLTHFSLGRGAVTDIGALSGLTNLVRLYLERNTIRDLTPLTDLTALKYLYLNRNNISDVSPLAGLVNLEILRLSNNPILDTSPLYPLLETIGGKLSDVNITITEYPPWDVNEDGVVDATDSTLVTAALGQSGNDIVNPRTDVNGDATVDADDLTLVTEHLDAGNAAPSSREVFTLLDRATLETLDPDTLAAQLASLRAKSDGSLKYQRAIALLESVLAAMRPDKTKLLANYPNPFNPETWIPYHLAKASDVKITIYDARGVVVRRLDLGHQREGYYIHRSRAAHWDGRNAIGERVASGLYLYQLQADNMSLLCKMVILK